MVLTSGETLGTYRISGLLGKAVGGLPGIDPRSGRSSWSACQVRHRLDEMKARAPARAA